MKRSKSLGIFLSKIAYDYVRYGYYEYVLREILEGKDLDAIDESKLSGCRVFLLRSVLALLSSLV